MDVHGEAAADAEVETDPGVDAGADSDAGICAGGWLDPTSGLCWQDSLPLYTHFWPFAMGYCAELDLGGFGPGSWHLPTISELRSLIRGCTGTESSGPCRVTDTCLEDACWDDSCAACPPSEGPGAGGTYWSPELRTIQGHPDTSWSSSPCADEVHCAWVVYSDFGFVGKLGAATGGITGDIRCVRPGP